MDVLLLLLLLVVDVSQVHVFKYSKQVDKAIV